MFDERGRERRIEAWMLATVEDDGVARFDDLHVDQIDSAWRPKEAWLDAAIEAYRIAVSLCDRLGLDATVAVAFSLAEAVDCHVARADLVAALDWSPPSLYIFRHGQEPWLVGSFESAEHLNPELFGGLAALFVSFRQDNDEVCRAIWMGEHVPRRNAAYLNRWPILRRYPTP